MTKITVPTPLSERVLERLRDGSSNATGEDLASVLAKMQKRPQPKPEMQKTGGQSPQEDPYLEYVTKNTSLQRAVVKALRAQARQAAEILREKDCSMNFSFEAPGKYIGEFRRTGWLISQYGRVSIHDVQGEPVERFTKWGMALSKRGNLWKWEIPGGYYGSRSAGRAWANDIAPITAITDDPVEAQPEYLRCSGILAKFTANTITAENATL